MRNILSLILLLLCLDVKANYWTPDPYKYANNMTVVGVVRFNDVEQRSEYLELGAFCGDECRGSIMAQYDNVSDTYVFYLMIYGEGNDEISFRCYDHRIDMKLDMIQDTFVDFSANAMIGNIFEPFILSFQSYQHGVSVDILPETGGYVIGDGTYNKYDTCNLEVAVNEGYRFLALKENDEVVSEELYYSFMVNADRHFMAEFALQEYEVTLSANPEEGGTVSGDGIYKHGDTVYAMANLNENYDFLNWSDDNGNVLTTNPQYVFEVKQDVNLIANFVYVDAVDENDMSNIYVYPNPASDFIIIENENFDQELLIYDMTGKIVLKKKLDSDENRIDVRSLENGTYIISLDDNLTNYKLIIKNL